MKPQRAHITRHAKDRAIQRLGCRSIRQADHELRARWSRSILVPDRYARQLCGYRPLRRKRQGPRIRMRVSGSTLFVCRGRTVITAWKLTDEQMATVLWWSLTNCWQPGLGGEAA